MSKALFRLKLDRAFVIESISRSRMVIVIDKIIKVDALAGASFAARNGCPVILIGGKQIKQEVLDYIGGLTIDEVYVAYTA